MRLLKKVINAFSNKTNTLVKSSIEKLKNKDYKGARKELDEAILITPAYEAVHNRGAAHYYLSNFTEAIRDYTMAIELEPESPQAYLGLGILYTKLENYQDAIKCYNDFLKINPKHSIVYSNRGYVKLKIKDFDGAIADFNKAIKLNPRNGLAYCNRGSAKYYLGKAEEACIDWLQAKTLGFHEAEELLDKHCFQKPGK